MTEATYRLYARIGAGSLAPQIMLEEIGAPYELVWISKSPTDVETLRRVSPAGKIPTLVLPDGTVVSESAAMVIHLTNTHPAADLAPPAGTPAHARFLQWMVFLSANVYEAALRFYHSERYSTAGAAAAPDIKAQALFAWTSHLELIHDVLSPYLLGARFTRGGCVSAHAGGLVSRQPERVCRALAQTRAPCRTGAPQAGNAESGTGTRPELDTRNAAHGPIYSLREGADVSDYRGERLTWQHCTSNVRAGCIRATPPVNRCASYRSARVVDADSPQHQFNLAALVTLLDNDLDIEAYCPSCRHFWPVSEEERSQLIDALDL